MRLLKVDVVDVTLRQNNIQRSREYNGLEERYGSHALNHRCFERVIFQNRTLWCWRKRYCEAAKRRKKVCNSSTPARGKSLSNLDQVLTSHHVTSNRGRATASSPCTVLGCAGVCPEESYKPNTEW